MAHLRSSRAGFTLIELLVVIAIIGLLSSVVLASLNSARQKAQYTAVAADLQEAYTAFYALSLSRSCGFPHDPGGTSDDCEVPGNAPISTLIANPSYGLSEYLPQAPSWPFSSQAWRLDNDRDTRGPGRCGSTYSSEGVNLYIQSGVTQEQYEALDKILDGDADPSTLAARTCGKILYSGAETGQLVYVLSNTP